MYDKLPLLIFPIPVWFLPLDDSPSQVIFQRQQILIVSVICQLYNGVDQLANGHIIVSLVTLLFEGSKEIPLITYCLLPMADR